MQEHRQNSMKSAALAAVLGALSAGLPLPLLAQPAAAPSVLEGAYNEEQALRGQALYYQHCLDCHGETMAGVDKAPALAGPQFSSTWDRAPLEALVARILSMPPEKPGSLSRQQSVDLLSYMLWYNGLPLGSAPLSAEAAVLLQTTFQLTPAAQ